MSEAGRRDVDVDVDVYGTCTGRVRVRDEVRSGFEARFFVCVCLQQNELQPGFVTLKGYICASCILHGRSTCLSSTWG